DAALRARGWGAAGTVARSWAHSGDDVGYVGDIGHFGQPLDRTQPGALGPRVRRDLIRRWSQGSAGEHTCQRARFGRRHGHLVGHTAIVLVAGPAAEGLLYHSVLERVVREHEHAPARADHVHRLVEPVREVRKLAIHLHTNRLE